MQHKLSPAQREQFEQQGWVICKNVFDVADDFGPLQKFVGAVMDEVCDAEIAAGNMTEAQAFRNAPFDQRLALIHAEGEKLGTTVAGAVYGAISVGGRGGELLNLLRHPNLLSLVTDLLGPDIIGSSVFRIRPKVPRHERGEVPWHQDSGYTMAHCDQTLVVTAWVPLVDATVENGCMYVLPWAFDQGIMPHKTGGKAGYLEIHPDDVPALEPIPMECKAGDVLLLHNLTPHASFTNSTADTVRWSLDLRFSDHAAPNNVGETPESYTAEREPVTMACYPPEADFVVTDTRHPEREVRSYEEFQKIRSAWRGVGHPGRGWPPLNPAAKL